MKFNMSAIITHLFLLAILLQVGIHFGYSQYFAQSFPKCFPQDFNQTTEIEDFDRLLVIPHLISMSLWRLSQYEIIPENNMRYNEYLSCVWKDRGFQKNDGTIDFETLENTLAICFQFDPEHSGAEVSSSRTSASRIVRACENLKGLTHGHKVVLVRNCVLTYIKNSSKH